MKAPVENMKMAINSLITFCLCTTAVLGKTVDTRTMNATDYYGAEAQYYSLVPESTEPLQYQGSRPGSATDTHSCDHIRAVPSNLRSRTHMYPNGLGSFYQKYTEAYGIPVLGSSYLPDSALQRACYVVRFVLADSYAARNSYYKRFGRFALMGQHEVTTHIPEHTSLGAWWNDRARGLGATTDRPVSTAGEENALCYSNDRYRREDIVLHEFSHGAHLLGYLYAVPGFDARLRSLYNNAKARGLWTNTYAMSTDREYFAEGVQSYFNVEAYANPPDGIHNHVDTRDKLRAYDPNLYSLLAEVFSCGNEYIKRCDKDRGAELRQKLKLNCRENGSGGGGGDGNGGGDNCEDSDTRCEQWSEDGWCDRCKSWMTTNCKKSCDECTVITTDCTDTSQHCAYWSSTGECTKNPSYMLTNCKKSCGKC